MTDDTSRELSVIQSKLSVLETAIRRAAHGAGITPMLGATPIQVAGLMTDVILDLRRERDEARRLAEYRLGQLQRANGLIDAIDAEVMSSNTGAASCVRIAEMIDEWEG